MSHLLLTPNRRHCSLVRLGRTPPPTCSPGAQDAGAGGESCSPAADQNHRCLQERRRLFHREKTGPEPAPSLNFRQLFDLSDRRARRSVRRRAEAAHARGRPPGSRPGRLEAQGRLRGGRK